VRGASHTDAGDIHELVAGYVDDGLLLPRSLDEITAEIASYVVVLDKHGRVRACAALHEYSPSLGEVSSVAVLPEDRGLGLGSLAVRGVESLARARGIDVLIAVTLADRFFESLGYERCAIAAFPEKLARYEALAAKGVLVSPKRCYRRLPSRERGRARRTGT
jgi:amino-acid N-acetyltransferase